MDDKQIFLSSPGSGIARASCDTSGEWRVDILLPEQDVSCLATDPGSQKVVYAGTKGAGVFRSDDLGKTWQAAGLDGQTVKAISVSPHDPDTVYAGCRPISMFVSRDGGQTWNELASFRRIRRWWMFSPADPGDFRAYVQAIALSPTDPDVILAGIELGVVVRSTDGGKTWSRHLKGTLRDCHTLKFHHSNGNWVYEAGGTGGGATVSSDGGQTWHKAKKGLTKNYGVACGSDPQRPDIWYVSVAPSPGRGFGEKAEVYLYRAGSRPKIQENSSANGSGLERVWQPIGWEPHPMSQMPTALVTDPGAPGHIYAGLGYGDIWHSTDYGDTWEKLPFNLKGIWFSLVVIRKSIKGAPK